MIKNTAVLAAHLKKRTAINILSYIQGVGKFILILNLCYAQTSLEDLQIAEKKISQQLEDLTQQRKDLLVSLTENNQLLKKMEAQQIELKENFKKEQHKVSKKKALLDEQFFQIIYWKHQQTKYKWQSLIYGQETQNKLILLNKIIANQLHELRLQQAELLQLTAIAKEVDLQHGNMLKVTENTQKLISELDDQEQKLLHLIEEIAQIKINTIQKEKEVQEKDHLAIHDSIFNLKALSPPLKQMTLRQAKEFSGAKIYQGKIGESIYAVGQGTVIFSDNLKGLGKVIMIDHGEGYLSLYANCQELFKKVGQSVNAMDEIALLGHSGQLNHEALYFELRKDGQLLNVPNWGQQKRTA